MVCFISLIYSLVFIRVLLSPIISEGVGRGTSERCTNIPRWLYSDLRIFCRMPITNFAICAFQQNVRQTQTAVIAIYRQRFIVCN